MEANGLAETMSIERFMLDDRLETTVYIARYRRDAVRARLVVFPKPTRLLDWCRENRINDAMTGGFFLREENSALGDVWIDGEPWPTTSFPEPWDKLRGSIYITPAGDARIDARHQLPARPDGGLLQAGPLLLRGGNLLVPPGADPEGFSVRSEQFDSNIMSGRYPRSAIGLNDTHILAVVCDGRKHDEAGLTMTELARLMRMVGANDALNLDGGCSATLVVDGVMLNNSRTDEIEFPDGHDILTSLVLEPR